ncbi:unnamed protein product [Cuscuta epithymum]|uniref:MATH domain-containing protein n=1 Tax=Cuscuta epithymum TaxID=186058 RepID=A0AAV0EN64_9ASTE|nr:unnamed protein product [Cuscuta epithymum]CAH9124029.1 unnamed protein product [Cuscuta epithymum]
MSKFTWRIENFSQLDAKKLYSVTFIINEYQWKLILYPKGNNTDNHLSLYLGLADYSRLPNDLNVPTKFSIALLNQIDKNKSLKKESQHRFNTQQSYWGFTKYMRLNQLNDEGGYLVNDTCLIQAELSVVNDKDFGSVDSVYVKAESLLDSLPKKPSNSVSNPSHGMPSFKGHSIFAKEVLDKLISCPMDDLADPKNEASMMEALSVLNDNLSLFSDIQAKEIMNLKATFPQAMQEWRDSIQVKGTGDHTWSTFEKTKSLLEDLMKTDQNIRTKLEGLKQNEKELKAELEVLKSNCRQLKVEREETSKQTKIVLSLAKEQASKVEEEEAEVDYANKKLEQRLKSTWASMRQLFA